MEGLFNPLSILLHVINAAILLVALYFLLLRPVRRFMNARAEGVEAKLQSVAEAEKELEKKRLDAKEEVDAAHKTVAETIANSLTLAQEQSQKILDGAHTEAEVIMNQATMEAESMRKIARGEMREEVVNLSFDLASKLLQREVTQTDHDQIIEEFLKKVG